MSVDLVEIMHELRQQLGKLGMDSLRRLGLAFVVNDKTQSQIFDFDTFEAVLTKAGLFIKRQELTKLYRHFDASQNEQVNYVEFLKALQGNVSVRRINLIRQVWNKLAQRSSLVPIHAIYDAFNAVLHPAVISGQKKAPQVAEEFRKAFDGAGGDNNGLVSQEEFEDYFSAISATINQYDDDYFAYMIENTFGVRESSNSAAVSPVVRQVQNVIREKIRQKTRTNKSEAESLRLALKHFDLDGSGLLNYAQFNDALRRYGVVLEHKLAAAIFQEFSRNGRLNYAEFSAVIYEDEAVTRSYVAVANARMQKPAQSYQQFEDANIITSAKTVSRSSNESLESRCRVVFVLGGPGSGKGTQCAKIKEEFGYVHLSAGDLLRAEQEQPNSPYGQLIKDYIKDGKIVPVEITINLIKRAIEENMHNGRFHFLVDGFPRNADNKAGWDRIVGNSLQVPLCLFFDCPREEMQKRLLERGKTSGRADDNAETIIKRFDVFEADTLPVVKQFATEGKLRVVSALSTPPQVYENVRKIIKSLH